MPTPTQLETAKVRIHKALDRGMEPAIADVEAIGGEQALQALRSSRLELKETLQQAAKSEKMERASNPVRLSPNPDSASSGNTQSGQDKKLSKDEKDYFDFIESRLGPLMTVILYLGLRDWDRAAFYALSPTECHELAGPISRMGPKFEALFKTPKWVHTAITTSDDTVTLIYVLAGYLDRIGVLDKMLPTFSRKTQETKKKYEPTPNTEQVANGARVNGNRAELVKLSDIPLFGGWSPE